MLKVVRVYYGFTTFGHRLHLGIETLGDFKVLSYCGNTLEKYDPDTGWQPQSVDSYCRNCFRTVAWQALEWAAANGWTPATVIREVKKLKKEVN